MNEREILVSNNSAAFARGISDRLLPLSSCTKDLMISWLFPLIAKIVVQDTYRYNAYARYLIDNADGYFRNLTVPTLIRLYAIYSVSLSHFAIPDRPVGIIDCCSTYMFVKNDKRRSLIHKSLSW